MVTCSQCHQPNHMVKTCTNGCEWPVGDEQVCGACSTHARDHHADCVLGHQLAGKITQPRLSLLKKQLLARRQAPHPAAPSAIHPLPSQQYPSGPQPRPQVSPHLIVGAQLLASVHPTQQPLTTFQPLAFQLSVPQLPTPLVTTPSSQNPYLMVSNPFLQ